MVRFRSVVLSSSTWHQQSVDNNFQTTVYNNTTKVKDAIHHKLQIIFFFFLSQAGRFFAECPILITKVAVLQSQGNTALVKPSAIWFQRRIENIFLTIRLQQQQEVKAIIRHMLQTRNTVNQSIDLLCTLESYAVLSNFKFWSEKWLCFTVRVRVKGLGLEGQSQGQMARDQGQGLGLGHVIYYMVTTKGG